jgi:UDP-GlcNAc:undecaprenyl-phosphate GlcNAc-1-phosphate transferase
MFDNLIGPERPVSWVLQFWPVPVFSFITALIATLLCKNIALKLGIVDKPDNLVKTHKGTIAYLGGVGIFAGLTVGILTGIYCISSANGQLPLTAGGQVIQDQEHFRLSLTWLVGILAGGAIACFVGLTDDIFDLKPRYKFLGQILAACVLLLVGIRPNLYRVAGPLHLPMTDGLEVVLGVFIVIFFVLGATNSLNLLDGLDGLCAGVTAIFTIALLLLSIHLATWGYSPTGDPVRMIVCLGLVGAVFGFLPFNRHPAKIFMGDAGSMLLGFTAAALMLLFAERVPRWWLASIVVFGLPILDTSVALVRRLANHRPLFVSDRGHIYDQMIDRGIPLKKTVAICYLLSAVYAGIGLAMSQIRTWYAAGVSVVVFMVSGVIIWRKGYLKMEGLRGAIRKE